eukprot:8361338-Pyramimonas_sp.AAC.1
MSKMRIHEAIFHHLRRDVRIDRPGRGRQRRGSRRPPRVRPGRGPRGSGSQLPSRVPRAAGRAPFLREPATKGLGKLCKPLLG